MKTLSFLLIGIVLVISTMSYAHAQQSNLAIYLQAKIQDSNGNLVGYLESARVAILDAVKLNKLIDENAGTFHKSIITIGGQKYEMIKASPVVIHNSSTIVSQNIISVSNGKTSQVLAFASHDGYPVVPGDRVTIHWTIIRPAS